MYFYKCCNRGCQCRTNRPSACKAEEVIPKPEPCTVFKTVSAGGVTLSDFAGTEKEYDLLYLDLDLSKRKKTTVELKFSCNLILVQARVDIRFQILKSGVSPPVPVASPAVYRHTLEFSGSDSIFFTVHDPAPLQNGFHSYLVKMYIMGYVPDDGLVAVTNPVLIAMMI